MPLVPARGAVWLADLDPPRGREQAGRRTVLVLYANPSNQGPASLVVILPLTSTLRQIPIHVVVNPPEGGLRTASAILCDAIRSISRDRIVTRWGKVSTDTLAAVEDQV